MVIQHPMTHDTEQPKPFWLSNFIDVYSNLSTDNLSSLADIYTTDVTFTDPLHTLSGLTELNAYFDNLYTHLQSCSFKVHQTIQQEDEAAIYWTMKFQHPKLNKGQTIIVEGHSHLKGVNDKVFYHRDFIDIGAMLYEHIPVLGRAIKFIKARATQ